MIGIIPRMWLVTLRKLGTAPQIAAVLARVGRAADFDYSLDQPYDDHECALLMQASQDTLGLSEAELFDAFALTFIQDSAQRWPVWFEMAPSARDFLERQPRIHDRFCSGLSRPGTAPQDLAAKFEISTIPNGLKVFYRSPNRLCRLYMALARALLMHYADRQATLHEPVCTHQGHSHCEIHILWPAQEPACTA